MDKEDCKALLYDIIKDLGIQTDGIRFHAVHRMGQRIKGRCRPTIFRFLSSEVRDEVWRNRSKLKNSVDHSDTYITEDFAREIQVERKILITHFYFSMFFVISAAI